MMPKSQEDTMEHLQTKFLWFIQAEGQARIFQSLVEVVAHDLGEIIFEQLKDRSRAKHSV